MGYKKVRGKMSDINLVIKIPKGSYEQIIESGVLDCSEIVTAIRNGVPFPENSETKYDIKDLFRRVENIEKQIKEDKEEQLKNLQTELDYAKFNYAVLKRQLKENHEQQLNELRSLFMIKKARGNG